MLALVFVHGYNLRDNYLQPFTMPGEPMTATAFGEYLLANGLLRFRIPMLFAISGYLFALGDGRPFWPRLGRRLRTLGVPYLAWCGLAIGLAAVLTWAHPLTRAAVLGAQLGIFGMAPVWQAGWLEWVHGFTVQPLGFQLWFIRTLLLCNLLYPLWRAIAMGPGWGRWVAYGLLGAAWVLGMEFPFVVPEGLLFFLLGVQYAKRGLPAAAPWPLWLAAALWVGLCVAKTYVAFHVEWHTLVANPQTDADYSLRLLLPAGSVNLPPTAYFMGMILVHRLAEIAGLITAWYGLEGLARRAMAWRPFAWASAFSFFLFMGHEPLLHYVQGTLNLAVPHFALFRLATYVLVPTAVIVLLIASGAALRAAWPAAYRLLTGGRGQGI